MIHVPNAMNQLTSIAKRRKDLKAMESSKE
jgi:hypothetical protein